MNYKVNVVINDEQEVLVIDYEICKSAKEAGFDKISGFPVDRVNCIGYPTMHAYFENMNCTGYRRYCGFIQLVERKEYSSDGTLRNTVLELDVPVRKEKFVIPYFSYGYPSELFDAPCCNLGDCARLEWKAYTYLVVPLSRISNNQISFVAGWSWGYCEDKNGVSAIMELELLDKTQFDMHMEYIEQKYAKVVLW